MQTRSIDGIIPPRPSKYIRYSAESAAHARIQYAPKPKLKPAAKLPLQAQRLSTPARKHKRSHLPTFNFKLAASLASLLLVAGFLGYGHLQHQDLRQLKEAALPTAHAAETAPTRVLPQPMAGPDVSADLNATISAEPALTASASVIDLDTGETYTAGDGKRYEAASTAKLVTVFAYIHRVETGKATLAQNVGGVSAQENIRRMIMYSDNDAWTRMNTYLTMPAQQAYVNSLGLTAVFRAYDIQFTSADMAKLLQQLYAGQLMTGEHQAMVYDYMAHTTVKNLVQAALPSDAVVYHKYGQIEGVLHDASIVEYGGHHFVLVVYTDNSDGTSHMYRQQVQLIQAVTATALKDITAS